MMTPEIFPIFSVDLFIGTGLTSDFKLLKDSGEPVLNPIFKNLKPIIEDELIWPIRHLVKLHGRTSFYKRQIIACLERYIAQWKG